MNEKWKSILRDGTDVERHKQCVSSSPLARKKNSSDEKDTAIDTLENLEIRYCDQVLSLCHKWHFNISTFSLFGIGLITGGVTGWNGGGGGGEGTKYSLSLFREVFFCYHRQLYRFLQVVGWGARNCKFNRDRKSYFPYKKRPQILLSVANFIPPPPLF